MFRHPTPMVAYFSMEIGLDPHIPTYSGGLGVLAGDTIRVAADLGVPMVAVTLVHRKGYFFQEIDAAGNQREHPYRWVPADHLTPMPNRVKIVIGGRPVDMAVWRFTVEGISGHGVPVYFLDTQLPENASSDQGLTDALYGGDAYYRLCQEIVLGFGGIAMLRDLGYEALATYHMNEGHSAFLTLALLEDHVSQKGSRMPTAWDCEAVRKQCVFTTHTPIPAGHDQFPLPMIAQALSAHQTDMLDAAGAIRDGVLNMTHLALLFSRYVNGVAMRHGEVSRLMFPHYLINAITNGVHATTWVSLPFANLYDRYIPEWRRDNFYFRHAVGIPLAEIGAAHTQAKRAMVEMVYAKTARRFLPEVFTIGFARRATAYKRADLLLADTERLRHIAQVHGPIQIVYGGKAHPHDMEGKAIIRRIVELARRLEGEITIVYLEEYDMAVARTLCAGVDLWLNTPQKPQEASGTSGMKAALNGVPSLSSLDGWWIEGHVEGVTGWSIAETWTDPHSRDEELSSLYHKLETLILPTYYHYPLHYAHIMRSTIAINGAFFHAQRMMVQYVNNAYRL